MTADPWPPACRSPVTGTPRSGRRSHLVALSHQRRSSARRERGGQRGLGAATGQNGRDMPAEFVIITGLSGAGRSQAAATFEDMGWFVIDNMPVALVSKVAELVNAPGSETHRVALVVGRAGQSDL